MAQKLRIGWFSFSCCEDSTIIFTELLNTHYHEWRKYIDFASILVMQRREEFTHFDVAFVEGAITSDTQAEKLKKIRAISKKLVAIGSCACSGAPSNQRNDFSPEKKAEIEAVMTRFSYCPMVKKLADLVPVDIQVSGCPMSEPTFLKVMEQLLVEFGIVTLEAKT